MAIKILDTEPEEMSYTETSEALEQIKKEEKLRKKAEKEYIFNEADIRELNRRLGEGEDLDEVTASISRKGMVLASAKPKPMPPLVKPAKPKPMPPLVVPTEVVQPTEVVRPKEAVPSGELIPLYLIEREKKKAKREEKKILRSEEQRIDYPEGECCSNVCNVLNTEIEQYIGIVSDKDTKLKFDTLKELRRQFYIQNACQCANGHAAQKSGISLKEEQTEDCCPIACGILNNSIDEYEGILFPTHNIRITSETLYNIRAKMYDNNACRCVETPEQLKKPAHGGPAMDPILQNRLTQLLKYAEKQGWVK
jgi:hypothetical protein